MEMITCPGTFPTQRRSVSNPASTHSWQPLLPEPHVQPCPSTPRTERTHLVLRARHAPLETDPAGDMTAGHVSFAYSACSVPGNAHPDRNETGPRSVRTAGPSSAPAPAQQTLVTQNCFLTRGWQLGGPQSIKVVPSGTRRLPSSESKGSRKLTVVWHHRNTPKTWKKGDPRPLHQANRKSAAGSIQ